MAESGASDAHERTEPATPKRLEDARRRGQVPRSRELTTTVLLVTSAATLLLFGGDLGRGVLEVMQMSFQAPVAGGKLSMHPWNVLMGAFGASLLALGPFLMLTAVVAFLGPMALGGFNFSAESLAPKWDKLDPMKGLKRVFSSRGLMEMLKALAKFGLLMGTAALVLWLSVDSILGLNSTAPGVAIGPAMRLLGNAFVALAAATLVIAAIDVPFQLWSHARQLRMSHQEVKDELKETEGKPEVRGRIRALQREMANRRMLDAVGEAHVVITNPTHYACALRYDGQEGEAPRVVAKGVDRMAERIRSRAEAASVPLVGAPALARAVYHHTRLGEEIPVGLYVAVAEVLAYVFQLRRGSGREVPPTDIAVPGEYAVEPR